MRRFHQKKGLERLARHVADTEQTGKNKVDDEGDLVVVGGAGLQLHFHLVRISAQLAGVDVDIEVDRRPRFRRPLQALRRVGVLEGQVLHILRQHAGLRLVAFAGAIANARAGKAFISIAVGLFFVFCHDGHLHWENLGRRANMDGGEGQALRATLPFVIAFLM